jgi:hypothetical protein
VRALDSVYARSIFVKNRIERLKVRGVKLFFKKGEIKEALNTAFKNGTDA